MIKLVYLWSERWGGSETEAAFQECPGPSANSEGLLLSQELEHGREVLLRVALGTHHPVDLVGLAAQEDGALGVGGGVLCQSQVLKQTRAGGTR